jgi:hypothetical protein
MTAIRPTIVKQKPRGMSVARLGSKQQRELIEAEAIDIFTAMTNGGCTFQQALAAIFLSGMSLAKTLEKQS